MRLWVQRRDERYQRCRVRGYRASSAWKDVHLKVSFLKKLLRSPIQLGRRNEGQAISEINTFAYFNPGLCYCNGFDDCFNMGSRYLQKQQNETKDQTNGNCVEATQHLIKVIQ